jgi:hypothetical protein
MIRRSKAVVGLIIVLVLTMGSAQHADAQQDNPVTAIGIASEPCQAMEDRAIDAALVRVCRWRQAETEGLLWGQPQRFDSGVAHGRDRRIFLLATYPDEGRFTTRPRRSTVWSRMSQKGQIQRSRPPALSGCCRFGQRTFTETHGSGRDVPIGPRRKIVRRAKRTGATPKVSLSARSAAGAVCRPCVPVARD